MDAKPAMPAYLMDSEVIRGFISGLEALRDEHDDGGLRTSYNNALDQMRILESHVLGRERQATCEKSDEPVRCARSDISGYNFRPMAETFLSKIETDSTVVRSHSVGAFPRQMRNLNRVYATVETFTNDGDSAVIEINLTPDECELFTTLQSRITNRLTLQISSK